MRLGKGNGNPKLKSGAKQGQIMKNNFILKILIFSLLVFPALTLANQLDYPGTILAYGTNETGYISGSCKKISDIKIKCKFTQALIRKSGKPEDLRKALDSADQAFESKRKPFNNKLCSANRLIFDALKTGKVPEREGWDKAKFEKTMKAPPRHRSDIMNMIKIILNTCDDPSRKNFRSMAEFMHDKKMRTCRIVGNSYEQEFSRSHNSTHWVSNIGPSGDCGVVAVDTLKKVEVYKTIQWTMDTRIIVTNKKAKMFGGLANCKDYPEEALFYDWKQPETFLACDYIEFGP